MNYSNKIICPYCGSPSIKSIDNLLLKCEFCNGKFTKETSDKEIEELIEDKIDEALFNQKQEAIANARNNLWQEIHKNNIDSIQVIKWCQKIKEYLPKDFQANFYEIASNENQKLLNQTIAKIDVNKYEGYLEDIINYMIKSLTEDNLLVMNELIERGYKGKDLIKYNELTTRLAEEVKKVNNGIYDTLIPRDVFIAYSSNDIEKVNELVEKLEEEGITTFVAIRNLQHGRGAVGNYEKKLEEAIDNCRIFLLVSSVKSRTNSDARAKEMAYVKKKDLERAPVEYQNYYDKLPIKYKKPRIEYLIEDYKGMAAERFSKQFFSGLEYRYTAEEVAERICELLDESIEETNQDKQEIEDLKKQIEILKTNQTNNQSTIVKEEQRLLEEKQKEEKYIRSNFVIENGVLTKYIGK